MRHHHPTTTSAHIQPPLFGGERLQYQVIDTRTGAELFHGPLTDCQYYITHKLQSQQKLEFARED